MLIYLYNHKICLSINKMGWQTICYGLGQCKKCNNQFSFLQNYKDIKTIKILNRDSLKTNNRLH